MNYCVISHIDLSHSDDVPVLLYVYEFNAKANLNHGDIEALLDKISKQPNVKAQTFETIAGNLKYGLNESFPRLGSYFKRFMDKTTQSPNPTLSLMFFMSESI